MGQGSYSSPQGSFSGPRAQQTKPLPSWETPTPIQGSLKEASLPLVFVVLRMSLVGLTNIQDLYFVAK